MVMMMMVMVVMVMMAVEVRVVMMVDRRIGRPVSRDGCPVRSFRSRDRLIILGGRGQWELGLCCFCLFSCLAHRCCVHVPPLASYREHC